MDNDRYGALLHAAILNELGITEPPFRLTIEFDVGGAAAKLRDEREGVDDFGEGKFVSACLLKGLSDDRIAAVAREAADAMREDLEKLV